MQKVIFFLIIHLAIFNMNVSYASMVPKASDLWLNYELIEEQQLRDRYSQLLIGVSVGGNSDVTRAIRFEIETAFSGLLGERPAMNAESPMLIIGTPESSPIIRELRLFTELARLGNDGFIIRNTSFEGRSVIVIASNHEIGTLYGAFRFIRELQLLKPLDNLNIIESPRIAHRMLNHWDNIMPTKYGTVERGYSGRSLWVWDDLPGRTSSHYRDYARAMASLGLNGVVLNNVNAEPIILTAEYLEKVAALADAFRPYGIRVFVSASYAAPLPPAVRPRFKEWGGIGNLSSADPFDPKVKQWWKEKAEEIYGHIPDFGGFLVKADSEGMHGPQAYGRNHADGANMMAEALAPYGGLVIWRAFVYDSDKYDDRAASSYGEFKPYDGQFHENVIIQVKNGPLDFQPHEPVHPLFGDMPQTPLAMEFQITQEYLGHNIHLVYLGPKWQEILQFDTYCKGEGSTVARVLDGSVYDYKHTVIAGVANLGIGPRPVNWTSHPFGQANWYAFGRLAWNPDADSRAIAEEWVKMTWSSKPEVVNTIVDMMMGSWSALVDYKSPLGLNFTVEGDPHYDPAPHRREGRFFTSNENGIGFDRTASGTNIITQYQQAVVEKFSQTSTIPEKYLLWFHFVPWDYTMKSGLSLWDELVARYMGGASYVKTMIEKWDSIQSHISPAKHAHVRWLLLEQFDHASFYSNECLLHFSGRSGRALPE